MAHAFKIDRVLLATDFSPACEAALGCAASLASRFNAELYLLHVVAPDASERRALDAMGRLRQQLLADHDKYTTAVLRGDPAARILQKAQDVHADLIVLGPPEPASKPRSVTDTVVRAAPCPVLTVPQAEVHP